MSRDSEVIVPARNSDCAHTGLKVVARALLLLPDLALAVVWQSEDLVHDLDVRYHGRVGPAGGAFLTGRLDGDRILDSGSVEMKGRGRRWEKERCWIAG